MSDDMTLESAGFEGRDLFSFWKNILDDILNDFWSKSLKSELCNESEQDYYQDISKNIRSILGIDYEIQLTGIDIEPISGAIDKFAQSIHNWLTNEYRSVGISIDNMIERCGVDRNEFPNGIIEKMVDDVRMRLISNLSHFSKIRSDLYGKLWDLRGYLSILLTAKFIIDIGKRMMNEEKRMEIRLNDNKIKDISLYVLFPEMIKHRISFNILDESWQMLISNASDLDRIDISDDKELWAELCYACISKNEEEVDRCLKRVITRLCSAESLRRKGRIIKRPLREFACACSEFVRNVGKDHTMLWDLFNFLIVRHGILEYMLFKFFADLGVACIPRVIMKDGSTEYEIDLLTFRFNSSGSKYEEIEAYPELVLEITTRHEAHDKSCKIEKAASLLRELFPSSETLLAGLINIHQEDMRITLWRPHE
ncbi:MAG: hypothetical protein QXO04_00555 [Nitrososphaerota archaeon]